MPNKPNSEKDFVKNLQQSKKRMVGHFIFTVMTVVIAFVVWKIWNPRWWIYFLILWAGPFALVGEFINIWYCKRKMKS